MRIIRDTREKVGFYNFECKDDVEVITQTVKTGDYTLEGLEEHFTIERKKSVSEIANNVDSKRFIRELERMEQMPHPYILLEFSVEDILNFPHNTNLPPKIKKRIRVTGAYILKRVVEIMRDYNIHILFCSNKYYAEEMAYCIIKRMWQNKTCITGEK